jgi:hypothetical protein
MSKSSLSQHGGAYGTMIPAGLFIGIGVGLITYNVVAGILIGFGLGIAVAYLVATRK